MEAEILPAYKASSAGIYLGTTTRLVFRGRAWHSIASIPFIVSPSPFRTLLISELYDVDEQLYLIETDTPVRSAVSTPS